MGRYNDDDMVLCLHGVLCDSADSGVAVESKSVAASSGLFNLVASFSYVVLDIAGMP